MSALAPVAKEGTSIPALLAAISLFASVHEAGSRPLARSSAHGQLNMFRAMDAAFRSSSVLKSRMSFTSTVYSQTVSGSIL